MIIRANAKINLTLDIKSKREDGYHLIDSVFQSVGLFDELTIEKSDKVSVICDGVKEDNNIAFTAAKEFFKVTGISSGARIEIQKHIPFLSGLGGGSADAAAVIIALDRIYGTRLHSKELNEIAIVCGADVPFCLKGGTARIGGIGENVTPLPAIKGYWAVVIKQGEKLSTADMYKRIDDMGISSRFTDSFADCILHGDIIAAFGFMGNAFSSLAADKYVLEALKKQNPIGVCVSGSGPSHFAVFRDKQSALLAEQSLKKLGFKPYLAPFTDLGCEIIE